MFNKQQARARRKGAALVEYVILMGLLAVVVIFSVLQLGAGISTAFDDTNTTVVTEIEEATGITIVDPNDPTGTGGGTDPGVTPDYPETIIFSRVNSQIGAYDFAEAYREAILSDPAAFGLAPVPEVFDVCGAFPDPSEPQNVFDAFYACENGVLDQQNARFDLAAAQGPALAAQTVWSIASVDNANGVMGAFTLAGNVLSFSESPLTHYGPGSSTSINQMCGNDPNVGNVDTLVLEGARGTNDTTELTIVIPYTSIIC